MLRCDRQTQLIPTTNSRLIAVMWWTDKTTFKKRWYIIRYYKKQSDRKEELIIVEVKWWKRTKEKYKLSMKQEVSYNIPENAPAPAASAITTYNCYTAFDSNIDGIQPSFFMLLFLSIFVVLICYFVVYYLLLYCYEDALIILASLRGRYCCFSFDWASFGSREDDNVDEWKFIHQQDFDSSKSCYLVTVLSCYIHLS